VGEELVCGPFGDLALAGVVGLPAGDAGVVDVVLEEGGDVFEGEIVIDSPSAEVCSCHKGNIFGLLCSFRNFIRFWI